MNDTNNTESAAGMDAADEDLTSLLKQIDTLFEPSPELHILLSSKSHELLAESHPTPAGAKVCQDTIIMVKKTLIALKGRPELDKILNCHPRLGATKVDSVHSQNEQKSLIANPEEAQKLDELNDVYERTFPGLRYVVFVNGRPRSEIMDDMRTRTTRNDINLERDEGIAAMCDIARDRLSKME